MADIQSMGGDQNLAQSMAAFQAASNAKAIVAADPNAVKFSVDAFKAAAKNINGQTWGKVVAGTQANTVVADALQQQSMWTRLASKIPFVKNWLGAEGQMNGVLGTLQNGEPGALARMNPLKGLDFFKSTAVGMDKVQLTRALYSAQTPAEIEQVVRSAKIADPQVAKQLIDAAKARLAGAGAQSLGTNVAEKVAQQVVSNNAEEVAKQALGLTLKSAKSASAAQKAFMALDAAGKQQAIVKALGGGNAAADLAKLGFHAKDARGLVAKVTSSTTAEVAQNGATKVVQTTTAEVGTTAASTGSKIKGFFGKLLGGAKGNFIVAGVFSLVGNGISLAQGKIGWKQFLGLTATDTLAYGAIGWGSAAAAGAIAQAIIPIPGAGFVIGLGLGLLGGWLYDKFVRSKVKDMLGGPSGGAAPANDPNAYNPNGAAPGRDPYAGGAIPAPTPAPGQGYTFQQAMDAINRLPTS